MDNSLVTALVITAIGMSLLFLSLVLFYGLILLLTAVTRERPATPAGGTGGAEGAGEALEDRALHAAAIAIALARADAERGDDQAGNSALPPSDDRDLSPWWALHHQDRLAGKGKLRRP